MLTHPTLDTLRALKLDGMAEAFTELQTQDGSADLTHAEWLGLLIDREAISRETKRFESRMRTARLRHIGAAPEDVDYKTRRGLDKALFQSLLSGKWIKDKRNLMITGPCGVGKTWLACALAQAACRDGVTVLYKRTTRLFDELELAHGDGRFPRVFKALPTIENLRRAFPYQRRLLKIVIKLSDDLNRKIPRREKSEHLTAKPRDAATTYLVSKHSLTAARQAIEELGPNAPRHKLLSYAATILEKQ